MTQTITLQRLADALSNLADIVSGLAAAPRERAEPEYVNQTEAARMLGCSPATIRNRIKRGLIKQYPAGLSVAELKAYARGETVKPTSDYRVPRAGRSNRK